MGKSTLIATLLIALLASMACNNTTTDPKTDLKSVKWWTDQLVKTEDELSGKRFRRERQLREKLLPRSKVVQATRHGYPNGIIYGGQWVRAERELRFSSECGEVTLGHRSVVYDQSEYVYFLFHQSEKDSTPVESKFDIFVSLNGNYYDFIADRYGVIALPLGSRFFSQLYSHPKGGKPDKKILLLERAYEKALDCLEKI